jgi:hypothetical protein
MSANLKKIIRKHIDFARASGHMDLDFVYVQLNNISKLVGNKEFINDTIKIVNTILDRDENGIFDNNDVLLLKKIFETKEYRGLYIFNFCLELFNAVLIAIGKVEKPMLNYDKESLEGIFFGIMIYILFKFGPTDEYKHDMVDILICIYETLTVLDNSLQLTNNIKNLFKTKGICSCLCGSSEIQKQLVEIELKKTKDRLEVSTKTAKENVKLNTKMKKLINKVNNLEMHQNELVKNNVIVAPNDVMNIQNDVLINTSDPNFSEQKQEQDSDDEAIFVENYVNELIENAVQQNNDDCCKDKDNDDCCKDKDDCCKDKDDCCKDKDDCCKDKDEDVDDCCKDEDVDDCCKDKDVDDCCKDKDVDDCCKDKDVDDCCKDEEELQENDQKDNEVSSTNVVVGDNTDKKMDDLQKVKLNWTIQ